MTSKNRATKARTRDTRVGQDLSQSDWARVLQDLYAEMRSRAAPTKALTHDEVTELLPAYLSAEQSGENVSASFPAVYQHLQTCAHCRALYDRVQAGMQDSGPWQKSETTSVRIVNERPLSKSSPWQIIYPPQTGKPSAQVRVLFQSFLIQRQAVQIAVMRGGENVEETLLLSDQIILDTQPILVQAWLVPDVKRENYVAVRITMQGPSSLTRNASAALAWGKHRYAAVFKRGQAKLKQVDASDLDSPISLTFDFPTHERPRRHSSTRPKPRAPKRATVQRAPQARKPRTRPHGRA